MILLLDLGNTNLDVGVYQERRLIYSFKTHSDKQKSVSEYVRLFDQFLSYYKLDYNDFEGGIICSVIPSLTRKVADAVESLIQKECLIVSKNIKSGLNIQIDNPSELGADLICDSLGAVNDYHDNCLIVDLGTCTKILAVTKEKAFKGCVIYPGIHLSTNAIVTSAAQISDLDLFIPHKVLGKNTRDSVSSGILYSQIYAIESFTEKIEEETGLKMTKIITGGDAELISSHLPSFTYNSNLCFDGLYDIFMKNKEVSSNEKK